MVPACKNADDLSITGLSGQLKQLSTAARNGNVNPDLLNPAAATFTVSNLGNYGVEMFTPVINLPQTAILGVCRITSYNVCYTKLLRGISTSENTCPICGQQLKQPAPVSNVDVQLHIDSQEGGEAAAIRASQVNVQNMTIVLQTTGSSTRGA